MRLFSELIGRPTYVNRNLVHCLHVPLSRTHSLTFSLFLVVDAMGKPPSELLNYQLIWLGSYDECIAIRAQVNNTGGQLTNPFKGRYCAAAFPLGPGGQVFNWYYSTLAGLEIKYNLYGCENLENKLTE